MNSMTLKRGDLISVLSGKDAGKTGAIEKIINKKNQIIVAGLNNVKKHARRAGKYPTGGIITKSLPMNRSKVMLICPQCQRPTKVTYQLTQQAKNRICKKCHQVVDIQKTI